ncbi:PR domain zinc finger protein 8 [Dufourea novaeangliae]|uniref:PR domain zinc finger protein 8 n=1 Tax=Dufourea novaeangliae TaxID=178035 RepID=A0A154P8G4_DUFNO|nr:PR domain zinc finger protein 8 [Dufourea novaeangliae]
MTMEDRTGGIDRAAPATSTTATTALTSSSPSSISEVTPDASYPLQRASKRSFDVAFLVAPDENLARRQHEKLRMVSARKERLREEISTENMIDPDRLPQNLTIKNYENDNHDARRYVSSSRLQKTPSPPAFAAHQSLLTGCPESVESSLTCNKIYDTGISCPGDRHGESRSAFTKVTLASQRNGFNDDGQTSPRSSISPDDRASYQSSVSPPVVPLTGPTGYKYAPFPTKMPYPFLVNPESGQPGLLENLKIPQIAQPPKVPSPKMPSFRPDLSPVYPNLSYNPISVFPPMADALTRPRFLATAAGVAGLLPPSFAALTLPAQNVCAKCNLSFRMTSDLVYHMRSHHKNENSAEAARRRREEKLRCPVCDESFRERHHLTRHMTAHQDKESDAIVDQVEVKRRATTVHSK